MLRRIACPVKQIIPVALTLLASSAGAWAAGAAPTAEQFAFFEKHVRSVLAESCFKCHGPEKQKHGLRLDSREALLRGGDDGPILTPENPEASPLVRALRREGDNPMPPKEKLPPGQAELLVQWVKMGAPYPASAGVAKDKLPDPAKHWAFQPVRKPAEPAVKGAAWVQTPIDRFVLAKLEGKGMTPTQPADRRTLLRRAKFDLTGLPPTAEEIEAFEKDTADGAFARVVDRLLASPHYGERWGRHWLDVARYADTKGYVFEEERRFPYAYTYRDWVIRALNEDVPYDKFLVAQIAADQMPGAEPRDLAAMGFLTVGRRFLNNEADIIDDRIDVVARGTMALTVVCARCHDHKYDPIPTADYYSLYGVFASSTEPKLLPLLGPPDASAAHQRFHKELEAREAKVAEFLREKQTALTAKLRTAQKIQDGLLAAEAGRVLTDEKLKSVAEKHDLKVPAIRQWQRFLDERAQERDPVFSPWFALSGLPADQFAAQAAKFIANQDAGRPWNRVVLNALRAEPPKDARSVAAIYGKVLNQFAGAAAPLADADEEAVRKALAGANSPTAVPESRVTELFGGDDRMKLRNLRKKVDAWQVESADAPPRAMVLNDLPKPVEPRIFKRGKASMPGDAVPRQFLEIVAGKERRPFQNGSGRLELAQAIAHQDNPLTARVAVNRVWMHHFGAGLVRTPGDFGVRSDPPTHPELLDYLATRFVEEGWSLKKLHRLIMLSATYQQASDDHPENRRADPENQLLWRMNRQRLNFEAMRDSLLAAAGALDLSTGGRAVGVLSNRRTVYASIDRQNLPGVFRTFDFASPDAMTPQRFHTVGPQQALFMMNNPFVATQAKDLAALPEFSRLTGDGDRLQFLYRRILARAADSEEVRAGLQFVAAAAPPAGENAWPLWQCGYGSFDETAGGVAFTPLPYWTGTEWQGGPVRPDPKTGWVLLKATGGHPGPSPQFMAIRRWTAPRAAAIAISGTLSRKADVGDGIRARVVVRGKSVAGDWTIERAGEVATAVERVSVAAGETVDFIVDCRATQSSDAFGWVPELRALDGASAVWNAQSGFEGPRAPRLDAWGKFAQVLLASNEFVFVD